MSAGATLSPGSNLGTLTIANDLTVNGGANYNWQIVDGSGVAGSAWDLVQVGGALTIASTATSPYRINLWTNCCDKLNCYNCRHVSYTSAYICNCSKLYFCK
jgi:hypothetical protein